MRHGNGDLRWFHRLPRESQVDVLAAYAARAEPRAPGGLAAGGAARATAAGARFWLGS